MFPLAFVAGWLQGHWWGFISRNYVVWPTFLLMNVFIALKGSHFWFLFVQASCFINGISDNNNIIVWKTIFFLQICATREYDVIKMLVLTDVFPRAPFENRFFYSLFSSHLQTGRRVIWRHFHIPIWDHKLRAKLGTRKTGLSPPVFLYWPFQGGTSVVVPYCYLFLMSVFILWFSYYVSDIFCKF